MNHHLLLLLLSLALEHCMYIHAVRRLDGRIEKRRSGKEMIISQFWMCQYLFAIAHVLRVWILASPNSPHKHAGKVVAQINTLSASTMFRRLTKPSIGQSNDGIPTRNGNTKSVLNRIRRKSLKNMQINLHKLRWPLTNKPRWFSSHYS